MDYLRGMLSYVICKCMLCMRNENRSTLSEWTFSKSVFVGVTTPSLTLVAYIDYYYYLFARKINKHTRSVIHKEDDLRQV